MREPSLQTSQSVFRQRPEQVQRSCTAGEREEEQDAEILLTGSLSQPLKKCPRLSLSTEQSISFHTGDCLQVTVLSHPRSRIVNGNQIKKFLFFL